jgi:monofunctional biosynthetic peptidoglycan transglycosylase
MKRRKRRLKRNYLLLKRIAKIIIWAHVVLLGVGGVLILSYKFVNPPTTSLAMYRKYFKHVKNKPFKFVHLKNIPYSARASVIRLEDPNFKYHHGLDLSATWEAFKINRRYGKKIAGGSTITQQITRTLFLTTHKNYLRKYIEVILALEMEVILSKDRILELYLNYVEFGKGVYGIAPGAYFHYHRDLSKLSRRDIKDDNHTPKPGKVRSERHRKKEGLRQAEQHPVQASVRDNDTCCLSGYQRVRH